MQEPRTIFREEALKHHRSGSRAEGELLQMSPRWLNWTYWLLVAVFLAGIGYLFFGRVNEYATGFAIIRNERRAIVTGGTHTDIAVQVAQDIEAKQPLLAGPQESIEPERLNREWNLQPSTRRKNPGDEARERQLASNRAQTDAAEGRIKVIAIFPGHYRTLLKPGNPLRLELTAFPYAYQGLTIDSIGDEVVGSNEVRRFLGGEIADSVSLQGSWVIVEAHLAARRFHVAGSWREYHDGMQGVAEARVRSEKILVALVPGLKSWFGGMDE